MQGGRKPADVAGSKEIKSTVAVCKQTIVGYYLSKILCYIMFSVICDYFGKPTKMSHVTYSIRPQPLLPFTSLYTQSMILQ